MAFTPNEGPHNPSGWDPDEAVKSLAMEEHANPGEDFAERAKRLMTEHVPQAALALTHLALHSDNERIRLDAARTIMDRALGKVGDAPATDEDDPLLRVMSELRDELVGDPTSEG
jgi:hypothetical protein